VAFGKEVRTIAVQQDDVYDATTAGTSERSFRALS
jgi:hypothetical protein